MSSTIHRLQARDLPLSTVTVFTDRAELKRLFKVHLQEGINEVIVEGVPQAIDTESIRVDGKGEATILEVQHRTDHATQDEVDSPKVKEMVKELDSLNEKQAMLQNQKKVYEKRLSSLDVLMSREVRGGDSSSRVPIQFDQTVEDNLHNLYSFHERKSLETHASIRSLDAQLSPLNDEIRKLSQQISQSRSERSFKRLIHITLRNDKTLPSLIEIELTYQVSGASWTPSYDVRLKTAPSAATMHISYYATIVQSSGEDWENTELVLSTAKPRSGGALPRIGTLNVRLYRREPIHVAQMQHQQHQQGGFGSYVKTPATQSPLFAAARMDDAEMMCARAAPLAVQSTAAETQLLATTFSVPQKKTIPSDGSEHKLTVAVLDIHPILLLFRCVPSKDTNVFLTATAINETAYPLLPGRASIYLNNAFTSTTRLKTIGCGEKFEMSLGVDDAVKVEQKPTKEYLQHSGLLNKTSTTIHEKRLNVRNGKEESVLLSVLEHIPKSTDEKIKVRMLLPEINLSSSLGNTNNSNSESTSKAQGNKQLSPPEVGASINPDNNLLWTVRLEEGEEKEMIVRWSVEFPQTERLEYKEAI